MRLTNYSKRILFCITVSLFAINTIGQVKLNQDRWNIKIGKAKYGISQWRISSAYQKQVQTDNYRVELNYSFTNTLEAGIYAGYSKFKLFLIEDTILHSKRCHTPFYGINCNFHILPYILHRNTNFDLYITGKLGGHYFMSPSNYHMHGARDEYGIGGGLSYYIINHFGLYIEYCKGKYFYETDHKVRYGLTINF